MQTTLGNERESIKHKDIALIKNLQMATSTCVGY